MGSNAVVRRRTAYSALVATKAARIQLDAALPLAHAAVALPKHHGNVAEAYEIAAAALAGLDRAIRESAGIDPRDHDRPNGRDA